MEETKNIVCEYSKDKFNKETLEVIEEAKEMMRNPKKYKSYGSVEELMEDLNL